MKVSKMAFVSETRTGGTSIISRFAALRGDLKTRYAQHRVYRTTLNELRDLTARELNDMGIGAGDIVRIAREAAYE